MKKEEDNSLIYARKITEGRYVICFIPEKIEEIINLKEPHYRNLKTGIIDSDETFEFIFDSEIQNLKELGDIPIERTGRLKKDIAAKFSLTQLENLLTRGLQPLGIRNGSSIFEIYYGVPKELIE